MSLEKQVHIIIPAKLVIVLMFLTFPKECGLEYMYVIITLKLNL